MGTHSHHLTLEDRCDLAHLHAAGLSLRHILRQLWIARHQPWLAN